MAKPRPAPAFPRPQMLRVVTTSDVSEKPPPSSQLASPEPLLPWAEYVGQAVGLSQKLLDPKRPFELELVAWLWRALVVALEFLHRHHSRAEQRYLRQLIRKALSGTGKLVLSCLLVAS